VLNHRAKGGYGSRLTTQSGAVQMPDACKGDHMPPSVFSRLATTSLRSTRPPTTSADAKCTCGEAVRFPDERSEELCEAKSQEGARSRTRSSRWSRRESCPPRRNIPRRSVATERRRRLNAGCSPPRARPARLRGNHGRPRRRRRRGHERGTCVRLPRWMHRLLSPRCQRRLRERLQRGCELKCACHRR